MKGFFVVVEGNDGAGKSTFLSRLEKEFREEGVDALFTREPGGADVAEKIRSLLLDPDHAMGARTEALLYAAARADHVEKTIRPALDAGKLVLCDRYVLSSLAYQGYGRGLEIEEVRALSRFATEGLTPDLTLFFALDPEESVRRKKGELDRMERSGREFFRRVNEGYWALAGSAVAIDAARSPEVVYNEAKQILMDRLREG